MVTKEAMLAKEEEREERLLQDFTTHSTRHTFATRSFEKNMNGLCVSGVLGHKSEATTRNIYTHVKQDILQNELIRAWS